MFLKYTTFMLFVSNKINFFLSKLFVKKVKNYINIKTQCKSYIQTLYTINYYHTLQLDKKLNYKTKFYKVTS